MGIEDRLVYYSHSESGGTRLELPRSALAVLEQLVSEGKPMTPKEISKKVSYAPRTVSFALRKLLGQKLVKKIPNLQDMRQPQYHTDVSHAKQLLERYHFLIPR
jgi:DNA-binding MarR family transcriptional regulator